MEKEHESVIEEVTRKMQAMTKMNVSEQQIREHFEACREADRKQAMSNPKLPAGHTLTDAKQIMLLAAAEESYSQCATVLQPVLSELCKLWDEGHYDDVFDPEVERVRAGLHLLEEAMGAHNRYMDSVK